MNWLFKQTNASENIPVEKEESNNSKTETTASEEAKKAEAGAKALFAGGADTEHMPTTELAAEDFDEEGNIDLISLLVKSALVTTRSEGRRAIEQGGVSVDGEKVMDIKHVLSKDALTGDGVVLKRGKKKFNKVFTK